MKRSLARWSHSASGAPLAFAVASALAVACGSSDVHNVDYGQPPDASWDAGPGGNSPYGSGGGSVGNKDAGPPDCSDDLKRCGEEFVFTPPSSLGTVTSVELRGDYRTGAWTQGDPMVKSGADWKVTIPVPYGKAVNYKYVVNGTTWVVDATKPTATDSTNNTNNVAQPVTCTNFTCVEPPPTPPGVFDWRDAVIYFVFVDRFFDGNPGNNCNVPGTDAAGNYKGGDWAGVKQKIDAGYFTDLGVNTLWVTVPFKNADTFAGHGTGSDTHMYSAYHGYWPYDPTQPESCFGSQADLKALVDAAHAKNLKVIFDYAMVHVLNTSPIFTQHNDWFWPNSNGHGGDCICGQGCDWNNDAQRCWFTDYLPHWNYTNSAARDFSVNAALELVKQTGVDGFRLDAIKHVDGSWLLQLRSQITSQIISAQNPPQRFYMVGETYDFGNKDFIKSFVDPATKLDGQFDFPMRLDLLKATLMRNEGMDSLKGFMDANEDYYGVNAVMSTFIGNHDMGRVIHMAEDSPYWNEYDRCSKCNAWPGTGPDCFPNDGQPPCDQSHNLPQTSTNTRAYERLGVAFAVLMTNKGAPLIYYGDEIGLAGAGDPDNRRMMQFTGLSPNQQYLYGTVKALTAARAAHPALRRGHRTTISVNAETWVYRMTTTTPPDEVFVAINRGDGTANINGLPSGALNELVTGTTATGPGADVPPRQARIFVAK